MLGQLKSNGQSQLAKSGIRRLFESHGQLDSVAALQMQRHELLKIGLDLMEHDGKTPV